VIPFLFLVYFVVSNREIDMSITVTIEEAQAKLKELVHQLAPGDEIIITENQQTVARLRSELEQPVRRPPPGLGKGSILYMAPDFDEPLDEMKEYME
jgi:antitoxin (DNA-binding transcriptional repressor) of toxin-antitoxin stability system